MGLEKIGLVAFIAGAVLTLLCVLSYYPNPQAVIQGSKSVEPIIIAEMALCGAPLGLGFVLAVVVALAGG